MLCGTFQNNYRWIYKDDKSQHELEYVSTLKFDVTKRVFTNGKVYISEEVVIAQIDKKVFDCDSESLLWESEISIKNIWKKLTPKGDTNSIFYDPLAIATSVAQLDGTFPFIEVTLLLSRVCNHLSVVFKDYKDYVVTSLLCSITGEPDPSFQTLRNRLVMLNLLKIPTTKYPSLIKDILTSSHRLIVKTKDAHIISGLKIIFYFFFDKKFSPYNWNLREKFATCKKCTVLFEEIYEHYKFEKSLFERLSIKILR